MKIKIFAVAFPSRRFPVISLITIFLSLYPIPRLLSAASQANVSQAMDLARPVLLDGMPDTLFTNHLKQSEVRNPHGNIMEVLFLVFQESIQEQNEAKKYWLSKLKTSENQDELKSELANYLNELVNASQEIANSAGSPNYSAIPSFVRLEAALERFEAKLNMSNLPYAEDKSLRTMVEQDRRFYMNSRVFEQKFRSQVLTSKPGESHSSITDQRAQEVTPQSAKGITTSGPPPFPKMLDFEAEDLFNSNKTMVSGGKVGPQLMAEFGSGWSNNTQLFWGQGSTGAVLDLVLDVPMAATYAIELYMTRAPDYGILKIEVDGKASPVEFHGYSPRVIGANPVQVGKFSLQAGQRKISFMITGKNQNSTGYAAGIDRVKLYPVGAPSR